MNGPLATRESQRYRVDLAARNDASEAGAPPAADTIREVQRSVDRGFVWAAAMIGTVYVGLVVAVGALAGKEAAGVASVALTALATAVFQQFERLRFKTLSSDETKVILLPSFSGWYLMLMLFAFVGLEYVGGMFLGIAVAAKGMEMEFLQFAASQSLSELLKHWEVFLALVGIKCFGTFLGGICCGRIARSHHYGYAALASFLATLLSAAFPVASALIGGDVHLGDILGSGIYLLTPFWFLYVLCALVGARAGRLHSTLPRARAEVCV
jgi:hypothetical protein